MQGPMRQKYMPILIEIQSFLLLQMTSDRNDRNQNYISQNDIERCS
jgi:hypothetical protein